MIATEKEVEKNLMTCHVCYEAIKVGESYEKITTHSKKKIIVHTDCIGRW